MIKEHNAAQAVRKEEQGKKIVDTNPIESINFVKKNFSQNKNVKKRLVQRMSSPKL